MEEENRRNVEAEAHKILKNEFRDEIRDPYAGIPEDELVTRDQAVLLREYRFRKNVRELNQTTLEIVIKDAKELLAELLIMQKSPYREICIADLKKVIEANQAQLKANILPLTMKITLLALEELFAQEDEVDGAMKEEGPKKEHIATELQELNEKAGIELEEVGVDDDDYVEAPELSDE